MAHNSFTGLVPRKLLIFILIFRTTSCPNSFAADGQHYSRIERLKTDSSGSWGSLKPRPLCPALSRVPASWPPPASHSSFSPACLEAVTAPGLLRVPRAKVFATSGNRIHRKKELPGSLGSWGQGTFLCMLVGTTLNSEWRNQKSDSHAPHVPFPRDQDGMGEHWERGDGLCERQKGDTSGWELREGRANGCYARATQFFKYFLSGCL